MDSNKILSANILDLIFDNRNKEYGAYELRNTYPKRIGKAILVTSGITLMIFAGSALAKNSRPINRNVQIHPTVNISQIDEKKPEIIQPKKTEVQTRTEQFTAKIEIKPDEEVKQPPPTQDEIKIADIGLEKHEGEDPDGIAQPNELDNGKGIIEIKKQDEPTEPFRKVEVDARFSGNWENFLRRNLNANVPADNGAPVGNHTIIIQFVVDLDGNVSDIKPITNLGYGMEQEAIRVLRKATKWEPAIQNGHPVKAFRRQPITFVVSEE